MTGSILGFAFNATIEQVTSPKVGGIFGNAQVARKILRMNWMKEVTVIMYIVIALLINAESGRPDVVSTINDFAFTPANKSAFESFTIVDDDVLEFDELFIAEFNFGPEIANTWNAIKGEPSTAFIVIRDDDCELIHNTKPNN